MPTFPSARTTRSPPSTSFCGGRETRESSTPGRIWIHLWWSSFFSVSQSAGQEELSVRQSPDAKPWQTNVPRKNPNPARKKQCIECETERVNHCSGFLRQFRMNPPSGRGSGEGVKAHNILAYLQRIQFVRLNVRPTCRVQPLVHVIRLPVEAVSKRIYRPDARKE
ncbi:ATP-binding cassette subfamily C [Anopheles sinensis]|uniref:ATP-binding cassette subfamily C n=1 Tax=Anopheles sinensis TaxID=74873 RepID=A0A084VM55_ANOSI|nr:ATP-binding cassette subfamily C [Anopheles sinensis]